MTGTPDTLLVFQVDDNDAGDKSFRVFDASGAFKRSIALPEGSIGVVVGPDSLLYTQAPWAQPPMVYAYDARDGSQKRAFSVSPAGLNAFYFFVNDGGELGVTYRQGANGPWVLRYYNTSGSPLRDVILPVRLDRYSLHLGGRSGALLALPIVASGLPRVLRLSPTGALMDSVIIAPSGAPVDWVGYDDYCHVIVARGGQFSSYLEDADHDGVCDTWEALGVGAGPGVANWKPPGADPKHANLYVQVSGMQGVSPNNSDLLAVKDAFATFASDSLQYPNPDSLPGITLGYDLTHTDVQRVGWDGTYRQRLLDAKADYFANDWGPYEKRIRERIYRFCFFADTIPGGPTGESPFNGQNILVTLGEVLRQAFTAHQAKRQAFRGTLMHELGHSIGLTHSGLWRTEQDTVSWKVNYKPNYKSVMNYLWQFPHPLIKDSWKLDFSRRARPSITWNALSETVGFGGDSGENTIIGDGRAFGTGALCPGITATLRDNGEVWSVVRDGGAVDLNQDCDTVDVNVSRKVHWRDHVGAKPFLPFRLDGANDLKLIDLRIKTGFGAGYGEGAVQENNRRLLLAAGSLWQDCDGDGISNWDEIQAGAADIDCNYVPDECDPARVAVNWPIRTLCPAGDADSLVVEVRADGVCGFDPNAWQMTIFAVRDSVSDPSFRFWHSGASGWAPTDTAWATGYDATTGRARIAIRRLSGCGPLALGVRVAGENLGTFGPAGMGSYDRDAHSIGSVDGFDRAHWLAVWPYPSTPSALRCYDLDGDGGMTLADLSLLSGHLGHSIPRVLSVPNGGQSFGYGEFTDIRWSRGWGDSARVSLYLLRDSQPGFDRLLSHNESDDGQATWPLYVTDAPATDYRIRVTHTAGAFTGSNSVGSDASDGTFTINPPAGDGCPVVDTRTPYGWFEENTVLGRSLAGAMGLDSYRLRWLSSADSTVRVRIRESEDETTALDQVRLVAIDRRADLRAYAAGERVFLGTPQPPRQVRTAAGRDITAETSGGGAGYAAAAGETLYVDLGGPVGVAGARPMRSASGGGPFLIDDGGGKGGGLPLIAASPSDARSVDAQVLSMTGILVQVPDGGGGWRTVAHHYPRERASETLFDSLRTANVRLVFLGAHQVRFLGALREAADSLEASKLVLRSAVHSRLGDVYAAVASAGNVTATLARGDTLALAFANPPVPADRVRDYFLLSRGVYTTNLPASRRPAEPPTAYRLYPSQPNPFRGTTTLRFDLPARGDVTLEIFDVLGRRVRTLIDRAFESGTWSAGWDGRTEDASPARPGVYLARFRAGSVRREIKLVVMP
jgi:hypothetical protein